MTHGISVFIPVYNAREILERNVKEVLGEVGGITEHFEIFIVDDGSTDESDLIAKKISAQNEKVKCLRYDNGPSRRENLALSFKKASYDVTLFVDADLSANIKDVRKLVNEINSGADVCIGSRYKGISTGRTFSRKAISLLYNAFLRIYYNSKIHDHQCGFKAFKSEVLLELVNEMGYDKEFKRGWFWDAELLIRAQRKGYIIKEIPTQWKGGKKSSFDIRRELRMVPYILSFKFTA